MAILTISRETGSGGKAIGGAIAESLGYKYVDKEMVFTDVRAAGKNWEDWGRELYDHCPTTWEKYDWSYRGFVALEQSVILQYAAKDNVVIIGRGGNFLLEGITHALRTRMIASVDDRLKRISDSESLDREAARLLMEKLDHDKSCFVYTLYQDQWHNEANYDLVFDAGNQPTEEIIRQLTDLLKKKDEEKTPQSQHELKMRAAAAQIKAALVTNPSLAMPVLDVHYDGKKIILKGVVHTPKEHKRIEDAARRLAKDLPLTCELHFRFE